MERAIALAFSHRPHPNPRVGTVIVDAGGTVVGEGAHVEPGAPHAEQVALAMAGDSARGATAYVTLEPCTHHGRTPPCVDALIEAGISRVVAALTDPDERVSGRGFQSLRAAGIEVEVGLGKEQAAELDPGYLHHRRTGLPLVTVKAALTLDGQMAAADGSSRWISDADMRRDVATLRTRMDALVVGAGAVLEDDPSLDLAPGADRSPLIVIVAGRRQIPPTARLLRAGARVVSPGFDPTTGQGRRSEPGGDRVDLASLLRELGEAGALDVMVEGGPTLVSSMVAARLASRFVLYYGPKLGAGVGIPMFGGVFHRIEDALEGRVVHVTRVGAGVRVDFALAPA